MPSKRQTSLFPYESARRVSPAGIFASYFLLSSSSSSSSSVVAVVAAAAQLFNVLNHQQSSAK